MLSSWRIRPCFSRNYPNTAPRNRSRFRAESVVLLSHGDGSEGSQKKKKVVVVGDGWAGLAAAHHLCHQGFDVTVLDGNTGFGSQSSPSTPEDVGISAYQKSFVVGRAMKQMLLSWQLEYRHFNQCSVQLRSREEFLKVLNLAGIDVVTVKLQFDRKVIIPRASNTCSGFDDSFGWTFFDLNAIYDKHKDESETFLEADFYHANELMAMEDERIIEKAIAYLSRCIKDIENVSVTGQVISRYPKSLTHFFPGSYKNMMRAATSFPNLFMAGDWIISRHGSWSQGWKLLTS